MPGCDSGLCYVWCASPPPLSPLSHVSRHALPRPLRVGLESYAWSCPEGLWLRSDISLRLPLGPRRCVLCVRKWRSRDKWLRRKFHRSILEPGELTKYYIDVQIISKKMWARLNTAVLVHLKMIFMHLTFQEITKKSFRLMTPLSSPVCSTDPTPPPTRASNSSPSPLYKVRQWPLHITCSTFTVYWASCQPWVLWRGYLKSLKNNLLLLCCKKNLPVFPLKHLLMARSVSHFKNGYSSEPGIYSNKWTSKQTNLSRMHGTKWRAPNDVLNFIGLNLVER